MPSLAGMPEDDDEPPVNAILRRAEAVLKAHDVGKPKGGGTLPEDPYEVLRECSEWVAKLADMVCSECQGSARLQAENARLRAALATLWEWNEGIQDGKGNHHPEDHLSIIRAALNHEQGPGKIDG